MPPDPSRRTKSRVALGTPAISLLVLMTARRIRRSFQAGRVFPDAGGIWGLRFIIIRGHNDRSRRAVSENNAKRPAGDHNRFSSCNSDESKAMQQQWIRPVRPEPLPRSDNTISLAI